MKAKYQEIRKQLAELIDEVGNEFENDNMTNDDFKELARNNFQMQRHLAINIGLLDLMEKKNGILQVQS